MIDFLELQDKNYEDNILIAGDNQDLSKEQPIYIAIRESDGFERAVGLTVQQTEDLIDKLIETLQKY